MANIYTGGTGNDSTDGAWDELYGGDGNDTLKSSRGGFVKAEGGAGRDPISLTSLSGWGTLYGGFGEDLMAWAGRAPRRSMAGREYPAAKEPCHDLPDHT